MKDIGDTEFGVQVGIGFLGKLVTAVLGLVGSIVVARVVGPSGYGVFYISMSISQFLENPVTGWATACKKRMTEPDFDGSEALGSVLIAVGVLAVVGAPASYVLLSLMTQNPVIPVAVPLLFTATSSYWALNTFLSGRKNFSLSVWSGSLSTLIQIVGKILLVLLGLGVWGMVGGTVIGPVLVLPVLVRWVGVRPSVPSWNSIRSIAEYARWSIPSGFVGTALSRMDTVLLGWLATASVAGKYQVGLKITMPAVFISSVIGTGLMGRVSNLESRDEDWKDDLWNSLSYGSLLSVPIFFGSLVIGEELAVTVFSGEYSGAGVFVVGLALHRLIKTQTSSFRSIITGLDRPDIGFRISVVSFVLNVVLGVGLWFVVGASGIVIATAVTSGVTYLLTVRQVRQITDTDFVVTAPFLKQLVSGAVMAVIVYGTKEVFGVSSWIDVVGYLVVGGVVYGGLELVVSHHLRSTARGIWEDFRSEYV
ncbi:lipopolysaccharide biosynthesis protein [Halorutilales archaeon Cl-col2-1]